MRFILMSLYIALLASSSAHANDCEARAGQIVARLGATIESRSSMVISLQHGAVPGGFTVGCDPTYSSPADGADLGIGWDADDPSESFWSMTGSAGEIITDAPSKAIEAGARACYGAARKKEQAELARGGVRYECTLTTGRNGSFYITIFRRDAAMQKEIDRQFEKDKARVKNKTEAKR